MRAISLVPLKVNGKLILSTWSGSAVILCSDDGLRVEQEDERGGEEEESIVAKQVLAIPCANQLRRDLFHMVLSSINSLPKTSTRKEFCSRLVNLDGGIFDNLPYRSWGGENKELARRSFYSLMTGGEGVTSTGARVFPRQIWSDSMEDDGQREGGGWLAAPFLTALREVLDAEVNEMFIENITVGRNRVELGGSLVLRKRSAPLSAKKRGPRSTLPIVDARNRITQVNANDDFDNMSYCIVQCHTDELLLLSLAMNCQKVSCSKDAFERLALDGLVTKSPSTGMIDITCYSHDAEPLASKLRETTLELDETEKVWEIYDPRQFLEMEQSRKRALLRGSGIASLPRPSQGEVAINNVLLEYMDEAVRGDILSRGLPEWQTVAEEIDDASARQILLRQMGEALGKGQIDEALGLRDEFVRLTRLRADPSQDEGAYDRYLDQDDWYEAARRRAMR